MPSPIRLTLLALGAILVLYALEMVLGLLPEHVSEPAQKVATNVVFLGAAIVCGLRALRGDERWTWLLFATGLLLWGLGDVYYTLFLWGLDEVPIPSPADIGYLGLYPPVYAGLALLLRSRVRGAHATFWVDGLIGALAVGALAAAVVFHAVVQGTGGHAAEVATNLAYPLADLLLGALVVGVLTVTGRRLKSAWVWIAGGLAVFAITDSIYLYRTAVGSYEPAVYFVGWPLAALMIAVAAWWPASGFKAPRVGPYRTILWPAAFSTLALGVLVYDHFERINLLALVLATASMAAVVARLTLTFALNWRLLAVARSAATTDALTDLGNRRRLLADLAASLAEATPADPTLLTVLDLNGFKLYNDTFGHPAGDALLMRLGGRLSESFSGRGVAYRMGGDEFYLLCPASGLDSQAIEAEAVDALSEEGEGFSISACAGSALLPREAATVEAALRVADQRMYSEKKRSREPSERECTNLLIKVLSERQPLVAGHSSRVVRQAESAARRLGLDDRELEVVRLAGALHDVGKTAIPDEILDKPAPLSDDEWALVRRHTIIGERLIGTSPALSDIATVVRSSHERIDGKGYPDGLRGEEIPIAAQILAVSDAFDAMVGGRPYRTAVGVEDALAELRRCAGTQFDPSVVEA
ncbi:MAG: HD domain-containing phosphohydrolase, partial [Solirubrobacteraceae bacterium]